MSREDLEDLLERVEERLVMTEPPPSPKPKKDIDVSSIIKLAEDIILNHVNDTVDDNQENWCYEAVLEAVYGNDIWEWINNHP